MSTCNRFDFEGNKIQGGIQYKLIAVISFFTDLLNYTIMSNIVKAIRI